MKRWGEINWEEFFLEDVFTIYSSVRLTKEEMTNGTRPFVGASDSNNGVTAFVGNTNTSLDKNVLGVNYNGSVVESFYHPYEAIFSDDVKRLHLKRHQDNKYVLLFIKQLILKQKCKYEYGYKFNGERMKRQKIMLPVSAPHTPDYAYMEEYMRNNEKEMLTKYQAYLTKHLSEGRNEELSLDTRRWKEFYIGEVFTDILRGKRLKTDDHIIGAMPYVSSLSQNNGVDNFISNTEGVRIFGNCLSLANSGSVGETFYHQYDFVASDHVTKLANKSLDKYAYLFISSVVRRISEKYGFNREINDKRLTREKIMLPVTSSSTPDYAFMSKYMRNLELKQLKNYIDKRLGKYR